MKKHFSILNLLKKRILNFFSEKYVIEKLQITNNTKEYHLQIPKRTQKRIHSKTFSLFKINSNTFNLI